MEPKGTPPPKLRNVYNQNVGKKEDFIPLQSFILNNYKIKISTEEIQKQRDTMWKNIQTYPRKEVSEYIKPFLSEGLELMKSIPFTSKILYESDHPRIFYVNVFRKK